LNRSRSTSTIAQPLAVSAASDAATRSANNCRLASPVSGSRIMPSIARLTLLRWMVTSSNTASQIPGPAGRVPMVRLRGGSCGQISTGSRPLLCSTAERQVSSSSPAAAWSSSVAWAINAGISRQLAGSAALQPSR
jgi:hypothetical protein